MHTLRCFIITGKFSGALFQARYWLKRSCKTLFFSSPIHVGQIVWKTLNLKRKSSATTSKIRLAVLCRRSPQIISKSVVRICRFLHKNSGWDIHSPSQEELDLFRGFGALVVLCTTRTLSHQNQHIKRDRESVHNKHC